MRLGHGEAEACAGDKLVDLDETLEDALLISLRDALARIADADAHLIALHLVSQGDGALGGELDGILHQVVEDFEQFFAVAVDLELRQRAVAGHLDIGGGLIGVDHLLDELIEVDLGHEQTLGPGLDLRHAHQTVDDMEQLAVVGLYLGDKLVAVFLALHHGQQVGKADDGIEGGAYLVTHIGQEGRLQAIALLGLVTGCNEGGLEFLAGIDALGCAHYLLGLAVGIALHDGGIALLPIGRAIGHVDAVLLMIGVGTPLDEVDEGLADPVYIGSVDGRKRIEEGLVLVGHIAGGAVTEIVLIDKGAGGGIVSPHGDAHGLEYELVLDIVLPHLLHLGQLGLQPTVLTPLSVGRPTEHQEYKHSERPYPSHSATADEACI